MPAPSPMLDVRARLDALPLDRAPLRRAGLLAVLLVLLLVAGKVFGPDRAAALAPADRQTLHAPTEEVSAAPRASGWTGGRVLAVLLLTVGAGVALVLHRRRPTAASGGAALDVVETHPLGPGQSLRLVACGDEVLLLSVAGDGARLLRHWPRERFDGQAVSLAATGVSFADALAEATQEATAPSRLGGPLGDPVDPPSTGGPPGPDDRRPLARRRPPRPPRPAGGRAAGGVGRGVLFPFAAAGLPQFGHADA